MSLKSDLTGAILGLAVGEEQARAQRAFGRSRHVPSVAECLNATPGRPYIAPVSFDRAHQPRFGTILRRAIAPLVELAQFLATIGRYDAARTR